VEFAITKRFLDRWIPAGAFVAEIGVGVGHYSEHLARRGCRIHLVDIGERLLDAAVTRLRSAGLDRQLLGASRLSATDLSALPEGMFDAVLLLGPLYHLRHLSDRQRALEQAARLLKSGGLAYAAGINRLAYLRDLYRSSPQSATQRRAFHEQFLRDGNLDPEHAPPIGFAHLTTVDEFRALVQGQFQELLLAGVESFTSAWQPALNGLTPDEMTAWLDLVEQTAATPEGLGQSDHFLFVGLKLN
jgi:ubiquinone/menaquinone biosynthesis C-methylase UbiE